MPIQAKGAEARHDQEGFGFRGGVEAYDDGDGAESSGVLSSTALEFDT